MPNSEFTSRVITAGDPPSISIRNGTACCRFASRSATPLAPLETRMRAFLDGETHGEGLLHELYDHILDEPIPDTLLALLRR